MTDGERQAALDQVAEEVRVCTRCRLHEQRTRSVPGEGNPETEVVFVGEGPGFNEDREGRPFVGRAGGLLVKLLGSVGWRREDVFITNVVKCRPPENRDPQPDEIAACAPFLQRQLATLDPALVVTLGRYSMGTFMPGARISQAHGTVRPADPATGARDALAFAMYHPAAALRATEIERTSFSDMAGVPVALLRARELRERHALDAASVMTDSDALEPDILEPSLVAAAATPVFEEPKRVEVASIELEPDSAALAATGHEHSTAAQPGMPKLTPAPAVPSVPVKASTPATAPAAASAVSLNLPAQSTPAAIQAMLEAEPPTDQLTLF